VVFEASRITLRRKVKARAIDGIVKLEIWIRQAKKLDRCVFFSPGTAGVGSTDTLAALELLRYVARLCVQRGVKLIVANSDLNVQQVTEEIIKSAYAKAGKARKYSVDSVRYVSGGLFAYAAGVMGLLRRERPVLNIFVGQFAAEALEISEAGRLDALFQFAGTSSIDQLPFFLATCDVTLLAGELYAAQSYLTKDPQDISWTIGQDAGKVIAILLILAGAVLASLGNDVVLNLLRF
jgi:hypothetical protein